MNQPKILFMDEPTHGIDVGAKAEIYKLDELSKWAFRLFSCLKELPEVLALCDRIMVMHHGQLKEFFIIRKSIRSQIMSFILENKRNSFLKVTGFLIFYVFITPFKFMRENPWIDNY